MDFAATVIFLIFYFVRPHDWVPAIVGLNVIKPVIVIGLWGILTRGARTPPWRWMTTPHEWIMVCYLLYGVYADPDWYGTFMGMLPVASFYFLTSQSLITEQRLDTFFKWWAGCVTLMCIIGVATDMGMDITNARELIDGQLGRLCLKTWLMDNPNALGHTAVTAFPLVYFTTIFRRDIGVKIMAMPLLVLIGMCVVATESKGAYLTAAASIAAALLVGRSLTIQLIVAAMLFIAGSAATTMLPRMANPETMRNDEGVMGRALAFQAGRTAYSTAPAGWGRFQAGILWEGETVAKATHSSIVQIGADLGPQGLFLYLSIMGCAARSLLTLKTDSDELERSRRLLFALLVGFFVSGWMINRSYHTEFFLIAGAATAFHKLAQERIRKAAGLDPGLSLDDDHEENPEDQLPVFTLTTPDESGEVQVAQRASTGALRRLWRHYGLLDFVIAYALLSLVVWFWDYLIDYFIYV